MRVDDKVAARQMAADAAMLGDIEGLCSHAAAARIRLPDGDPEKKPKRARVA